MSLRTLALLREALVRPDEFFERPPALDVGPALGVVLAVALLTTGGFAAIGWLLAANVDATVTVTTMEPWPDSACEGFESMEHTPEPCTIDEPRTKQVDVGAKLWSVFVGKLPLVFVGTLVGWVLVAGALHVVSGLFDAEGSFTNTLAVAGWASAPTLLQTLVGVVGLAVTLQGMEFADDPAVLERQFQSLASGTSTALGAVGALVATAWQAYIWTFGLQHGRDLDAGSAGVAAGIVAVVTFLLSL